MSEKILISKIIEGDEYAFRTLIDTHKEMVIRTCYNFLHNEFEAEDAAQESFIEIYYSIKKFNFNASIGTWIYKITVNKCIDLIRKKNRKKRIKSFISIFSMNMKDNMNLAQEIYTPENIYENHERYKSIINSIDKLPENQRIALTLSKFEDLSYKEIADIMDSSVSAVEGLIFRAKTNLKNYLINKEGFDFKQTKKNNL